MNSPLSRFAHLWQEAHDEHARAAARTGKRKHQTPKALLAPPTVAFEAFFTGLSAQDQRYLLQRLHVLSREVKPSRTERNNRVLPEDLEWRPIPFAAEYYEISSEGDVRSLTRRLGRPAGRLLRPWYTRGYAIVALSYGDIVGRKHPVHRLVALAFHGQPPNTAHLVAHNDGDPKNNHYSNLRWATHVENYADRVKHGTAKYGENV